METPRLHPQTIEQVRQKLDIVDVVSTRVVLRRQGKGFVGLCPFHDDKHPSLHVNPQKQLYHCFSCGAGGDAIKFLMELGKTSFQEVILDLAHRYQVPIRTLEPEQQKQLQQQLSRRQQLYEILAVAAHFYEYALAQKSHQMVWDYLTQKRHLTPETIKTFQLGYAPHGWQTLYSYLVEHKGFPAPLVEEAGLIVKRPTGGYYDRFRNRLMIPIRDSQGRVIGFGGRSLDGEEPKYLNSPETPLFNKSQTLFALDRAKEAITRADYALVVEGYFDAIALHQAGLPQTVAVLGTALNADQVRLLLRYTESKRIVLNFDADPAGQRAVERVIGEVKDMAYRGEVALHVLYLPAGKDAADYLQHHTAEDYQALVQTAPLWLDWQINRILLQRDSRRPEQFPAILKELAALLRQIPNPALRLRYISAAVNDLSQGNARLVLQLEAYLHRLLRSHPASPRRLSPPVTSANLLEAAEAQLLRIYLHLPQCRQAVVDALDEWDLAFGTPQHRWLWQQIRQMEQRVAQTGGVPHTLDLVSALQRLHHDHPTEMQQVQKLFQLDEVTELELRQPHLVIQSAVATIARVICEKNCKQLLSLWQERSLLLTQTQDHEERQALLDELQRLQDSIQTEKNYLEHLDRQRCLQPAKTPPPHHDPLPEADILPWEDLFPTPTGTDNNEIELG
ncbi:MAG: DNA primase [Gloeomargarita sp. SKYG116]|nr:DNA primase [Gloeomargarita sp. SKYG116]MCS7226072.1 DNA primase [Gloeomargarita sp. SKYB31]MDW8401237.1 DNA primase [Gloeomargarita sp. SKYGB_i_bin116]